MLRFVLDERTATNMLAVQHENPTVTFRQAPDGRTSAVMSKEEKPTTIKKYANRRLYNTGTSSYVTLDDLAQMVKDGENFAVVDAKSGDDITRSVLTQIIFEQEGKGQHLLPVTFLRQLIPFYGDQLQNLVPAYLDFSIGSLVRDQEKLRSQMTGALGTGSLDAVSDQVRRNTEMFEHALKVFLPFGATGSDAEKPEASSTDTDEAGASELEALKSQLDEMQKRLDKMSKND